MECQCSERLGCSGELILLTSASASNDVQRALRGAAYCAGDESALCGPLPREAAVVVEAEMVRRPGYACLVEARSPQTSHAEQPPTHLHSTNEFCVLSTVEALHEVLRGAGFDPFAIH